MMKDKLYFKAMQLSALLSMIGAEGHEHFSSFDEKIRSNYLWACNDLADDIEELAEKLAHSAITAKRSKP